MVLSITVLELLETKTNLKFRMTRKSDEVKIRVLRRVKGHRDEMKVKHLALLSNGGREEALIPRGRSEQTIALVHILVRGQAFDRRGWQRAEVALFRPILRASTALLFTTGKK